MLSQNEKWLDAQRAVIGSALIDSAVIPEILAETTEDDYSGPCKTVFTAIRNVFNSGKPTDPITINAALGGDYTQFLMGLMDITPTAANVAAYIDLCRAQSRFTRLREIGQALVAAVDMDTASALAEQINQTIAARSGLRSVSMEDAMYRFFERHSQKREYLPWPLEPLNRHLFVERGDFVVIGGYPSAGKSAFAIQTAYSLAQGRKVGFFSLETNPDKLHDRLVAYVTKIAMSRIKTDSLTEEDWEVASKASAQIIARNLHYVPAAGATVSDIRAYSVANQFDVIVVDYLQLVSGSGKDRFSVVTDVSIGLHTMAQSTGITVIALAQLSRPDEVPETTIVNGFKRETGVILTKPPDMHDLRESGQIEQDADVVLMLYKPRSDSDDRMMLIRKNKEGELRSIGLGFNGQHQAFYCRPERLPDDTPVPFVKGK